MTIDATQQGVSAEAGEENKVETKERPLSPRELAMQAISASRNEQFEEESGVKLSAEQVVEKEEEDPVVDQLDAQLAAPVVEEDFTQRKMRLKIDGEEREMTIEQMQREVQKHAAADKRLAEATRMLNEAKAAREQVAQQTAPVVETPKKLVNTKEFTSAMFAGDEDAASEKLAAVVEALVEERLQSQGRSTAATPIVDTQAIAAEVKQQMVIERAIEQTQADYPQLFSDPDVDALAGAKIQRAMEDEGLSFVDALNSVATGFATKFGWEKSGVKKPVEGSTTTRARKLEMKQSMDDVNAINLSSNSAVPQPQTPSDVIAAMKAARGIR